MLINKYSLTWLLAAGSTAAGQWKARFELRNSMCDALNIIIKDHYLVDMKKNVILAESKFSDNIDLNMW